MSSGWIRPCTRIYTSLPELYTMHFRPLPDCLASRVLHVFVFLTCQKNPCRNPDRYRPRWTAADQGRPPPTKVGRPGGTPVQTVGDHFTTAWSSLIEVPRSAVRTGHKMFLVRQNALEGGEGPERWLVWRRSQWSHQFLGSEEWQMTWFPLEA